MQINAQGNAVKLGSHWFELSGETVNLNLLNFQKFKFGSDSYLNICKIGISSLNGSESHLLPSSPVVSYITTLGCDNSDISEIDIFMNFNTSKLHEGLKTFMFTCINEISCP